MIILTGLEIEEFLYQLSELKLLKQDSVAWKCLIGCDASVAVEMASTYHFSALTRAEMTALRAEQTCDWGLIVGRAYTSVVHSMHTGSGPNKPSVQ